MMDLDTLENSIVAYSTNTYKEEEQNQDAVSYLEKGFNVIMVADGIGTSSFAKEGAKFVIDRMDILLQELDIEQVDFQELFIQVQKDMNNEIPKEEYYINREVSDERLSFGTTLIVAIETAKKFIIGYVGNGAIIHIRGNITEFSKETYYLPWVCTNYLNPHSEPTMGQEGLTKHFALGNEENQITPSVIEINKDNIDYGDLLVICTDGIYSADQNDIAKDEDGNIWMSVSKPLVFLIDDLRIFLESHDLHQKGLELTLNSYLGKLKETHQMQDDCTLGVLMSGKAIEYQKSKNG